MEEQQSQAAVADPPAGDDFARLVARRRQQAVDLLTAHRAHMERVESEFDTALDDFQTRLEADHNGHDEARAALERTAQQLRDRADELSRREADLAADRAELAHRQAELELERDQIGRERSGAGDKFRQERQQLEARAAELDAQAAQLRQKDRELAASQHEHQLELDALVRRRTRQDQEQARLEKELDELEMRREQTRSQRHRIAQQLRAQHAEIASERDALEQDRIRLQQQIRRDRAALDDELAALEQARQQLRRERAALDEEAAALQVATKKLEESRRKQGRKSTEQSEELRAAQQQMAELLKERNAFANHIVTLEEQLAAAEARVDQPGPDPKMVEDLERRCQMALEDVRELKHRNAELEEALASGRSSRAPSSGGESQDWESTKRRLMVELEGDGSGGGKMREEDRLTVEGAIRITDEIVAQREREIAELKQALAGHGGGTGSAPDVSQGHAAEAAAAEVLDKDELVRAERERLLALQSEWKDKVRQAEVDISVERARLARQRTELEEQMQALEAEKAELAERQAAQPDGGAPPDRSKPTHRWLDRLGLKDRG